MFKKTRLAALLLAAVLTAVSFAGCGDKEEPVVDETKAPEFINLMNPPGMDNWEAQRKLIDAPELGERVADTQELNEDVVGWLSVPNTSISAEVLQGPDNDYYLRRNLEKRYSYDGVYFVDYRANVTSDLDEMSHNIVIYGHSMNDDPDSKLFSQLKRYEDIEFARANPYIFFSTEDKDMVWEVFAVFYTKTDFKYHRPQVVGDEFQNLLTEATKRSMYIYDKEVGVNDHILTLSTCTYKFTSTYPNDYRYVVMARLVGENETLASTANVEQNPSPKQP